MTFCQNLSDSKLILDAFGLFIKNFSLQRAPDKKIKENKIKKQGQL